MIGCKNKVLRFIYVLIYEDNFPVFSTCVEVILVIRFADSIISGILYMRRGDSDAYRERVTERVYSLHA